MRGCSICLLTVAGLLSTVSSSFAKIPSFQGLGDLDGGFFGSKAYGISADGSVVVGQGSSSSGGEAFRWTSEGMIEASEKLCIFYKTVMALSADMI